MHIAKATNEIKDDALRILLECICFVTGLMPRLHMLEFHSNERHNYVFTDNQRISYIQSETYCRRGRQTEI